MYVLNDIVYADEMTDNVRIVAAKPLPNGILLLTFQTGEKRLFDISILKGAAFKPLLDESVFNNVKVTHGYVSWNDGEIDCSPEYMYDNSYKYSSNDELNEVYAV